MRSIAAARYRAFVKTDLRTLALFAIASGVTIALGSLGLSAHGVPFSSWIRNPAAYLAGLLLGGIVVASGKSRFGSVAAVTLTVAALAATLFAPAQSGVHRWIDLGPLHINIASLLLPAAIVALSGVAAGPLGLVAILSIGALLALQPDASQASAFAVAALFILWRRTGAQAWIGVAGTIALAALVAATWLRPDELQPVAEVEDVFQLLASDSVALAAAASLSLAITSALPLAAWLRSESRRTAALPLASYFIVAAIMPLLGAYPVPLVGIGMSFPVGYWLGMSLLCSRDPAATEKRPLPAHSGTTSSRRLTPEEAGFPVVADATPSAPRE